MTAERQPISRAAYRVREIAGRLGMAESSVYRLIAAGDLACYRLARNTVRVGEQHLQDYLDRSECPASEPMEAGPSAATPPARDGTPIGVSKAVGRGYLSALRKRARREGRSQTSKPNLTMVKP